MNLISLRHRSPEELRHEWAPPVGRWTLPTRLGAVRRELLAVALSLVLPMLALLCATATAVAADKTFPLASGATALTDVTDWVGLRFTGMRLVPAQNRWLLDVCLTNRSERAVPGPLVMWIESYSGTSGPLDADGVEGANPSHGWYDFASTVPDGVLWPADKSLPRTIALGYNGGAPAIVGRVYARWSAASSGLALARVLDATGLPMTNAVVRESGPAGERLRAVDAAFGLVTLGQTNGLHTWRFEGANHLPVWRQRTLQTGEVALLPAARLARRAPGTTLPITGGVASNGSMVVTVPAGALGQNAEVRVSALDGQSLPGALPPGWSPLQAFWMESASPLLAPAAVTASLGGNVFGGETAALVQWNTNAVRWDVVRTLTGPFAQLATTLPSAGAYALVVPDAAPGAPPAAAPGQPLAGVTVTAIDAAALTAGGRADPAVRLASRDADAVSTMARVSITNRAGALPSGVAWRVEFSELYQLPDGSRHRTPVHDAILTAYQRPGDTDTRTVEATLPLRPKLLLGPAEIDIATVRADVLQPSLFPGRVLGPAGGTATAEGISLRALPGDLGSRQIVSLRALTGADRDLLGGSNFTIAAGFDVGLADLVPGRRLSLQATGLVAGASYVLARVLTERAEFGLEPVERLASSALGLLGSLEPASGPRLPGLDRAGQYALVPVLAVPGLIVGVARDASGQAVAGLPVRIAGTPWLTWSGPGGSYQLIAPAGAADVTVIDPSTGDSGRAVATVPAGGGVVTVNLGASVAGPRVVSVTPTNGAVAVARVSAVTVQFSEPVAPATLLAGGLQLLGSNGVPVAASLSLNLANTVATLLPVSQLAPATRHVIRVSTNVTDLGGQRLEGPAEFAFTTETDVLTRPPAQVISYEPQGGLARMVGSAGTAEPGASVILVNDTTGQTMTILSRPDGSFSNAIPADVDDLLSAVLVNQNGTRNVIPVSRQLFRDGSVGLFRGGGILEAESDGGPVQVIVEPGSIPNKTRVWLKPVDRAELMDALNHIAPSNAVVLGGFVVGVSGDDFTTAPDVSFPIDPGQLGLPPGADPAAASYALAIPLKVGGDVVYQVVDTMGYENGRLVTHSPPFLGMLVRAFAEFYRDMPMVVEGVFVADELLDYKSLPEHTGPLSHVLFTPVLFSMGGSVNVVGKISVQQLDASGVAVPGQEKPVPGALVRVSARNFNANVAGRLRTGELFALSDSKGSYAFPVPIDPFLGVTLAYATHPRFPGQVAYSGQVTVGSLYNRLTHGNAVILNLNFTTRPDEPGEVDDRDAPLLTFSHAPLDPRPGIGENDGAMITVGARDDYRVGGVTLAVLSSVDLETGEPDDTAFLQPMGQVEETGATLAQVQYWLTSEVKAAVRLRAQATDAAGNLREADYTVNIVGDRVIPVPSDDAPGPQLRSSWPANGAVGIPAGSVATLRFSSEIQTDAAERLNDWLQVTRAVVTRAERSVDGREVRLFYWAEPGAEVTMTVGSSLLGVNAKPFDQDWAAAGDQSASVSFRMAVAEPVTLSGIQMGSGAMTKGAYGLVLDSLGDDDGALSVFDLRDETPVRLEPSFGLPPYPRDMCLIPQYSYRLNASGDCVTADLLAVVGGRIGPRSFQYLWIIDVTDPRAPKRVASAAIAASSVAVTRVKWTPPYLEYLEMGASVTSIGLVHLQKFILGMNATEAEIEAFPFAGEPGEDGNRDGDYCDAEDVLPMPPRSPTDYFGKDYAITVETTQRILDFDVDAEAGLVGVTLSSGKEYPGATSPDVPPAYRTVFSGLTEVDPIFATFNFAATDEPRRVAVAAGVVLDEEGGQTLRDLALVSLRRDGAEESRHVLAVLDITDAEAPELLNEIDVSAFGVPRAIHRRADGMMVLAMTADALLLDPSRLTRTPAFPGEFPALAGVIRDLGSGTSVGVPLTGANLVATGAKNQVIRTGPRFSFITFPERAPFLPAQLAGQSRSAKETALAGAQEASRILPGRLFVQPDPTKSPVLNSPPDPLRHVYVRVDALAKDRSALDLALVALNGAGEALPTSAFVPPATVASEATLTQLGLPVKVEAGPQYLRNLQAVRLSDDPGDPFYSVYLAGPIVLSEVVLSSNQVAEVRAELDRVVLRAGRALWVGLDPGTPAGDVPGAVSASVVQGRLINGQAGWAKVDHVDRPLIFIPGMAGSHLEDTNSVRWPTGITDRWLGWWLSYFQQDLEWDSSADRSVRPIAASDVIRGIPEAAPLISVYGKFLEMLTNQAGYVEYDFRQDQAGKTRNYKDMPALRTKESADYTQMPRQPNLFVFPYDWRQDVSVTAAELADYVELVRRFHPEADRVDIVAHSMGGVVARRFILDHPDTVGRLVTIGTPWLGAPKALAAMETGEYEGLNVVIRRSLLKSLAAEAPGVHQLLPSRAYFDLGGVPMAERNWDVDGDGTFREAYSYEDYRWAIDGVLHPNVARPPVARNEALHAEGQDDWRNDTSEVDYFHIYGIQAEAKTLGTIVAEQQLRPVEAKCNDLRFELPWELRTENGIPIGSYTGLTDPEESFVVKPRWAMERTIGDGTVPVLSASRQGGGTDLNAPNARLLPVYSQSPEEDPSVEHNQILGNEAVHKMVVDVLSGFEPAPTSPGGGVGESFVVRLTSDDPDSAVLRDSEGRANSPLSVDMTRLGAEAVEALAKLGITSLCESYQVGGDVLDLCPMVSEVLAWVVRQAMNDSTVEWQVFNTRPGNLRHQLEFSAKEEPYSIEVLHQVNGVTDQLYRWAYVPASYSPGVLTLTWGGGGVVLTAGPGGSVVAPTSTLSGPGASDDTPPSWEAELVEVADNRLDSDDDAYLQLRISDNQADEQETRIYLGYDRNGDGSFTNDVFHPVRNLTQGATTPGGEGEKVLALPVDSLEASAFALVTSDGTGIPSGAGGVVDPPPVQDPAFCERITAERAALEAAIAEAVAAVGQSGWILPNPTNITASAGIASILEQGSGACLWQADPCTSCTDVFTPNKSDHDLELFLPVFSVYSGGIPAGFASDPHSAANMQGDWYFKPPVTNGTDLVYTYPSGATTNVVLVPGWGAYTPAARITRIFTETMRSSLNASGLSGVADSLTVFPARNEHFQIGLMDLERPTAIGADGIGDAGLGRQMLLLKWVLEGEYVPGYAGTNLDEIQIQLAAQGIPKLEGYEWAVFQEFAALRSGLLLQTTDPVNVGAGGVGRDYFRSVRESQIKSAGKAAIRAALGRMVALGRATDVLITRTEYRNQGYRTFEDFIAGQIKRSGVGIGVSTDTLEAFAKAKRADKTILKSLLSDPVSRNEFLAAAVNFLRDSQLQTAAIYHAELDALGQSEREARVANLSAASSLVAPLLSEATLDLRLRLFNDGPHEATEVRITMEADAIQERVVALAPHETLDLRGDADAGTAFYLRRSVNADPREVRFKLTSNLSEYYTQNNWFGFWAYPLSLTSPGNIPAGSVEPPSGLPDPDDECEPWWFAE